jgi:DNA-binding response OmpR family regulator
MDLPYILLAEDDPNDEERLRKAFLLANPELDIVPVSDGPTLMAYLNECAELPALLLIDYDLPLMNAEKVLEEMFHKGQYRQVLKFVWSSSDNEEYSARCKKLGALNYFHKPSTPHELFEIVSYLSKSLYRHWLGAKPESKRP